MKRTFLFTLLAALMLCVPSQAVQKKKTAATPQLPKKEMSLQLYSIRSVFDAKNYGEKHAEIFKKLAAMGYTSVEAASYGDGKFYGVTAEQFKSDLAAAGLTALSSHTNRQLSGEEIANHDFTAALKWWDQAIAAHKAAGMKYIVMPWGAVPKSLKDGQTICDYYNAVGKKCREAGLSLGYHTHSHEYQKVEGEIWIEYMLNHVDAANMFWQMDVYWCVMAQQAPVEWFNKFPGRFKLLHIKDHFEVGYSGMVGYDAIFKNAQKAGLEGYVVELERATPGIDILDGVKMSADYLRAAPFVKASYAK